MGSPRFRRSLMLLLGVTALAATGVAPASAADLSSPPRAPLRVDAARASLSLARLEGPPLLLDAAARAGSVADSPDAPTRKNPLAAFLMSSLLPGWGELYAGHTARGRGFIAAEAAIWLGYAAFEIQGSMREDDYEEFARVFADVDGHIPDGYYADIADYIRSEGDDSFNEAVRSDARSLYPDDLDAQREYFAANGYFGELAWDWENRTHFREYRALRHEASVSFQNAFYMTGLAVLNRAVSAVDSAWMARRHNEGARSEPAVSISVGPEVDGGTLGGRAALEFAF